MGLPSVPMLEGKPLVGAAAMTSHRSLLGDDAALRARLAEGG